MLQILIHKISIMDNNIVTHIFPIIQLLSIKTLQKSIYCLQIRQKNFFI